MVTAFGNRDQVTGCPTFRQGALTVGAVDADGEFADFNGPLVALPKPDLLASGIARGVDPAGDGGRVEPSAAHPCRQLAA